MARTPTSQKPAKKPEKKKDRGQRLKQIRTAFSMTRKADRHLIPYLAIAFVLPVAVLVGLGILLGQPVYFVPMGLLVGLTMMVVVFGRRAVDRDVRAGRGAAGRRPGDPAVDAR